VTDANGRREGADPVVLLHGLLESPAIWARTSPLVAAQGGDVWAPTLPGHGPDAASGAAAEELMQGANLARAYLDEAKRRFDGRPVRLAGHSTGALVALDMAIHDPGAVRDVLVVAGLDERDDEYPRHTLENVVRLPLVGLAAARTLLAGWLATEATFLAGLRGSLAPDEELEWVPMGMRDDLLQGDFQTLHAVAQWLFTHSIRHRLDDVHVPVLGIVPTRDPVVAPEQQIELLSAMENATGMLIDSGHLPMLSAPETFERLFSLWLAGAEGRRPEGLRSPSGAQPAA